MYKWTKIKQLKQLGYGKRRIAKQLKISKTTVKKYLSQASPPMYRQNQQRASYWSQFKEEILKGLGQKKILSVIFENLVSQGATGGRSSFYEYVKQYIHKKISSTSLSMRYETAPGKQGQFDWAEYKVFYEDSGYSKVYILTTILSNSRKRYNVPSQDVTQSTIFQSMELSFRQFNGVPEELLIDNPRQLIDNANPQNFKINQKFEEFAAYYNFRIKPCKIRHPQTKGKVENPFRYLENHFIKNNTFKNFEDLQKKLEKFTEQVNKKYHRGLGDIPEKIFKNIESVHLQPISNKSYFTIFHPELRQVNHTGTITYKSVAYSVPVLYSKQMVRIEAYLGYKLKIFSMQGKLIAEHNISSNKGGIITKKEHYEPLLRNQKQDLSEVKENFLKRFPEYADFPENIKKDRKTHYLSDLSKILQICDYYKLSDVEKGFQCCRQYQSYNYQMIYSYLKNNCEPKIISEIIPQVTQLPKDSLKTEIRDLNYYDNLRS